MTDSNNILENDCVRLTFEQDAGQVSGFSFSVRANSVWQRMGSTRPLSRVIYRDGAGNRCEWDCLARVVSASATQVCLEAGQTDADGVAWKLRLTFALADNPHQIALSYVLETGERRGLLHWVGPAIHAGEGSFGAACEEAIFPGLEYLLNGEPSSDTAFASEKHARRYLPHPYKITVPLMAVGDAGRAVGLMWDPNQDWYNAWRHPAALFSSPNRLEAGAQNHWLALCAPAVEPRFRDENELEAHSPCTGSKWTLSARLVAVPEGGVAGILRQWVQTYGLPALPLPQKPDFGVAYNAWQKSGFLTHSVATGYAANVELCVRSYLDVAWDEEAEGWHHTLSDPWGPRYEPRLANQLWRYGCWPGGDPLQRVRARDQVRRAIARARQKDKLSAPHLDLALVCGHVADAVEATAAIAHKWMSDQQPDGSWAWTPDVVQNVANFKTQDRLARMGAEHDSATGLTSTRALSVLPFALLTGDPDAVGAIRNAADWCNRQRRPEGAQTWELHLHVPDVLAAPYLIDLNLGAYELTGDATYLQAAQRWAWTGLPFTYLWNGWYRPVMRYGTVPVFGVTFHDVQPWFGVIVQWNGLVYADALWRLARYSPADGPIDWRSLAEGITQHGMQEQMTSGPNQGMYPDAYSPVKGDEEYTWWLNPQLIGLNTFPLAGLPVHPDRRVLRPQGGSTPDSTPKYVTSGAQIAQAQSAQGKLQLTLLSWPGATSFTVLGGLAAAPAQVTCEGVPLARVEEVDGVDAGWQWLAGHRVAVIKLCHTQPGLGVSVMV